MPHPSTWVIRTTRQAQPDPYRRGHRVSRSGETCFGRRNHDMAPAPIVTIADPGTVDRLSEGFHDAFRTLDAGADTFAPDAFFDLNMPVWRFQLQGREAFSAQLAHLARGDVHVDVLRTVATASGFVTEHVERQMVGGDELSARRLWLCEVRDGRITEVVGYCSGEWDARLRARHAAEAPMIRP
jgi:ketosteroid isomerase-like protein